jgi:hypothetical protein
MNGIRRITVAKTALFIILIVAATVTGWTGEKPEKRKRIPGTDHFQIKVTDGAGPPVTTRKAIGTKAVQSVVYDDGSREAWAAATVPNSGAAGNKFLASPPNNWGTFYCDIMSAFAVWTGTGVSLYYSMWTGTTNAGADLIGNTYTSLTGLPTSASGWVQVDGSTSSWGFIGNSTDSFSNTAWLGVYVYSGNDVGLDTNGPGNHGFYVDSYTGTGYNETSWNAMVRARFNGDSVPVELMSFSAE